MKLSKHEDPVTLPALRIKNPRAEGVLFTGRIIERKKNPGYVVQRGGCPNVCLRHPTSHETLITLQVDGSEATVKLDTDQSSSPNYST